MAPAVRSLHDPAKVEDYITKGWFSRETVDEVFRARVAEDPTVSRSSMRRTRTPLSEPHRAG